MNKSRIIGTTVSTGALAVLIPLAVPTAASAMTEASELEEHAYTLGRTMQFFDCWNAPGRVYLQAKPYGEGPWKTVATTKAKRNGKACPGKKYPYRAVFNWKVNQVGAPGSSDRATVLPMREATKNRKGRLATGWKFQQKIYRNEDDRTTDYYDSFCKAVFGGPC